MASLACAFAANREAPSTISCLVFEADTPPEPKRVIRFDYELPAGKQFNRKD
jgi:hypothetical protein